MWYVPTTRQIKLSLLFNTTIIISIRCLNRLNSKPTGTSIIALGWDLIIVFKFFKNKVYGSIILISYLNKFRGN